MAHAIEGILGVSMEKIREMVDVNTIVGEPINTEGATVIPISKVSFGFASGGTDLPTQAAEKFAGGSGAGITVKPVAFIVIKADGDVKLMELGGGKSSPIESAIEALPGVVEKIKAFMADKKAAKTAKAEAAKEALDEAEKTEE